MQEIKEAFDEQGRPDPSLDEDLRQERQDRNERLAQADAELREAIREQGERTSEALREQSTSDAPSGTVWDAIDSVGEQMHKTAKSKGWYDPPKSIGEQIALWHSECSEALEEARNKDQPLNMVWFKVDENLINVYLRQQETVTEHDIVRDVIYKYWDFSRSLADPEAEKAEPVTPGDMEVLVRAGIAKPEGFSIEAADVVIRIMDTLEANGISLGQAIRLKSVYNATRPHRHGGKAL